MYNLYSTCTSKYEYTSTTTTWVGRRSVLQARLATHRGHQDGVSRAHRSPAGARLHERYPPHPHPHRHRLDALLTISASNRSLAFSLSLSLTLMPMSTIRLESNRVESSRIGYDRTRAQVWLHSSREGTPLELAAAQEAAKLIGSDARCLVDGEQVFQVKPLETLHEQTSSEVALPPNSRVECKLLLKY